MTALVWAVLVASLLGSAHCAGMCGAFLAIAVTPGRPASAAERARLHAAYNAGRLVTYLSLGFIAGLIGAALDLSGSLVGVQRTAAIAAGSLMIAVGAAAVARSLGYAVPHPPVPPPMRRALLHAHRAVAAWPPFYRAAAIGLFTTLLPCGWLYTFVIAAAGTASPLWGSVSMAAFWLGTLPVMVSVGVGVQAITGPLARRLPLLTSLLLVTVGLFTLSGRLNLPALDTRAASSIDESIKRVNAAHTQELPCCHGN